MSDTNWSEIFSRLTVSEATRPEHGSHYERLPRWEGAEALPPSRVLLLVAYGIGVVMEHTGDGAAYWLEGVGPDDFCTDMGMPDEDGLWVFEGTVRSYSHWTDCGTEYDEEFEGDYRRMTPEEQQTWVADRGTIQALWDEEHDAIIDEWPCRHCGSTFAKHKEHERKRIPVVLVHERGIFQGFEQTFPCPTEKGGRVSDESA